MPHHPHKVAKTESPGHPRSCGAAVPLCPGDGLRYLAACCAPLPPDKAAVFRAHQLDALLRQTTAVTSFCIRNQLIPGALPDGAWIPGENDHNET